MAAMGRAGTPLATLGRFASCGANAYVLASTLVPGRYRIASDKCHCRWCVPCATERRSLVAANLHDRMPTGRVRFLTLTLKSQPGVGLRDRLDRLYQCFTRWRTSPRIRPRMEGGLSMVEITWSAEQRSWHTHLHVLCTGSYLPHEVASAEWHRVTGDSYVVDIREVKKRDIAVGYVVKYAGWAVDGSVTSREDQYVEAIRALRGRRMLATWGTWRRMDLTRRPDDGDEWIVVMPLHRLIAMCDAGDADAARVMSTIRREPTTLPVYGGVELNSG